jgi:hypothetical protein
VAVATIKLKKKKKKKNEEEEKKEDDKEHPVRFPSMAS